MPVHHTKEEYDLQGKVAWMWPGIDFTESYASDINYVSFRMILIVMMVWDIKAKIINRKEFSWRYQVIWKWANVNFLS
jgi:hypothetical protein